MSNRVCVAGVADRMGRTLAKRLVDHPELNLTADTEQPGSAWIGRDLGELIGVGKLDICVSAGLSAVIEDCDTVIDFTRPEATLEHLSICLDSVKNLVVGTTGFTSAERQMIDQAAAKIGLVIASNFAIGVNAAFKLVEIAARILGPEAEVEIVEMHHNQKIDAPSGTALTLGEVVSQVRGSSLSDTASYGRHSEADKRKAGEIGIHSLRGGSVVGEHSVIFATSGERIEITHRAESRENFAEGALRACQWLRNQPHGIYTMSDVLDLEQFQ